MKDKAKGRLKKFGEVLLATLIIGLIGGVIVPFVHDAKTLQYIATIIGVLWTISVLGILGKK